MNAVKPGLAAVLCAACRHPARRHTNLDGCLVPDCWCDGEDALTAVVETAVVSPPSAAELALLDARCLCGHLRTEHRVAGSSVICRATPCLCHRFAVPGDALPWNAAELEATDAPVAPQAEPTPPPAAAAPAPALAAAAPGVVAEARRGPAAPKPTARLAAPKRPRRTPARPAGPALGSERAADGEPDAVEEVAAAAVDEPVAATAGPARPSAMYLSVLDTAAELLAERRQAHWDPPRVSVRPSPSPFDFEPFLARALYVSARWYCPRCHQWPLDPGACPGCRQTLQAVYHVTIPRSLV